MSFFAGLVDGGFVDYWEAISAPSHLSKYPNIHSSNAFVMAGGRRRNKKPTTVSSRGFLSKFCLTTSADGVVSYNDYQQCDMSNIP